MNTTGIFTVYRYEIQFEKYGEPIYIVPFGDVHRSSPLCHAEKWKEFLDWAKGKERCYFLGMGDYDDLASGSERQILVNKALHESTITTLEDLYRKFTDRFHHEVSFMEDRCIGLLEGNHYGEFQNGTTTTQKLAELMKCKYLGVSSFIRLSLHSRCKPTNTSSVDIWAHHGKGAARLVGGSLNRVEQMLEAAECDIALMGHDHKKSVGLKTRLSLNSSGGNGGLKLHQRKILFARTGSFLKGYEPEAKSYIADAAMNPTDLGVIKIELTPKRERRDGGDYQYIDIHCSI
jgi:hypothetical protein